MNEWTTIYGTLVKSECARPTGQGTERKKRKRAPKEIRVPSACAHPPLKSAYSIVWDSNCIIHTHQKLTKRENCKNEEPQTGCPGKRRRKWVRNGVKPIELRIQA